jgi:membrane-bound lytic murein transglycosylase D
MRWVELGMVAALCMLGGCATPVISGPRVDATLQEGRYVPAPSGSQARGLGRSSGPVVAARAPGDIWDRVRIGLRLNRRGNARVDGQARGFARDRRYLAKLSAGAQPYLHVVLAEIERRGLPAELALLPQVESRFNPAATSRAAAAGMWQFIPSTGSSMGLHQSPRYDGRRDLLESTRAALDYLEQLHRRLGGDWELAMAAYNCGPSRVESAQAANRARGAPTDFWSLNLPAETENYVPAVLAVARLVAAPDQFGLVLPPLPDTPQIELVIPPGSVDLGEVARAGGVAIGDLQRLNAGLKQGRTEETNRGVLVPVGAGQQVSVGLPGARVVAARVSARPGATAVIAAPVAAEQDGARAVGKELVYQVREGDSLGSIARRFGISVGELRERNAEALDGIAAGGTLRLVPVALPQPGLQGETAAERGTRPDPGELNGFTATGGLAKAG